MAENIPSSKLSEVKTETSTGLGFSMNKGLSYKNEDKQILFVFGVSYRTAPIVFREKLAIPEERLGKVIQTFRNKSKVEEVVLLSTCNRTEAYLYGNERSLCLEVLLSILVESISNASKIPINELVSYIYSYTGQEAVSHLFKVTAGLDAMIFGETQISSQVKRAYEQAKSVGTTGSILNPLFQKALRVAKAIHAHTRISEQHPSVPSVALELAEKVFGKLEGKKALVIGTGEIGTLTLKLLKERGLSKFTVCSRASGRAQELAGFLGTQAITMDKIASVLPENDIVIACTQSESFISGIDVLMVSLERRKGFPILFLDLGVPRNIDPAVKALENVFLYNIDDLEGIIKQGEALRKKEMDKAMHIIDSSARTFMSDFQVASLAEAIYLMRERGRRIGEAEFIRILSRLPNLSENERGELRRLIHRMVNKVLHQPTELVKGLAKNGSTKEVVTLIRSIVASNHEFEENGKQKE